MTLNVEKMRRNQARRTPDAVWKSFDVWKLTEGEYYSEYHAFVELFGKMMQIKHGNKFKSINAFLSESPEDPNLRRIQLVAEVRS